jgi:hypothetical protein
MRLKLVTSHISNFSSTPRPPDMICLSWLLVNVNSNMNDAKFHIQFSLELLNVGLCCLVIAQCVRSFFVPTKFKMNRRELDCALRLRVEKVVTHVVSIHTWKDFCGTDTKFIIVMWLETPILQCYYLGGLEDSATGILGELSKPLSWSMPAEKVCEKLKKKDSQICDLRYGKLLLLVYMTCSVSCLWWNPS